jgi:hypothetical protein
LKIAKCEWDKANIDHLTDHRVEPEEAEEVLVSAPYVRRAGKGRYLAYGITADGRCLLVVFRYKGKGVVRVITARDMTTREKKRYKERRQ